MPWRVFRLLTVRRSRFAPILALAATAVLLAGAQSASAATPLDGEGLSGTGTSTSWIGSSRDCGGLHPSLYASVHFSVTGTASGPHPGSFSETGRLSFTGGSREFGGLGVASFNARFKITSGTSTITGSFAGRSPADGGCNSAGQVTGVSLLPIGTEPNASYTATIHGQTSQGTASLSGSFVPAPGADSVSQTMAVTHGRITGTVTDSATGAPVGGICVDAYDTSGGVLASSRTTSSGAYTLSGVPAGSAEVGFATGCGAGDYLPQYYDAQPSIASADPVSVTAGATTSGINAAMVKAGQIKGKVVSRPAQAPLAGICVRPYNSGHFATDVAASTNANGDYMIAGLQTGSYRVRFWDCNHGRYVTQYYKDKRTLARADPVSVTIGVTTSRINAAMVK